MKARQYGLLLAILSPIFSSAATIFQSGASKLLTPVFIASIGSIIGGVIIFFVLLSTHSLPSWRTIREQKKDLMTLTILRFVVGALIFAWALSLTTGIKAIFFTKAEPYFVLLWYWLFQKGVVHKRHVGLLGVHIIGAIVLSIGGNFELSFGHLGDVLIIIAIGLFSLSYVPASRLSHTMGSKQANFLSMSIGGLIILPFAVMFAPTASWNIASVGWSYLLAWVVLFNVIGLTMWFASLKTVTGWMVSALRAIGPISGIPIAYLLFGETLSLMQIGGAALILFTSILIAKEHLRR